MGFESTESRGNIIAPTGKIIEARLATEVRPCASRLVALGTTYHKPAEEGLHERLDLGGAGLR